MSSNFSRRVFLGVMLSGVASVATGAAPEISLRPQMRPTDLGKVKPDSAASLIRKANLGGSVGFAVVEVKTGHCLEGHNQLAGQPPASVTKAVTALYALDTLGAGHRFETRLLATAPLENGVIEGDLILAGGADPTLDTTALAKVAKELKAAGLRMLRGRFLVYGGMLPFTRAIDEDQPEQVGYNPCVSGINLNFNRVHFEWQKQKSGYALTMDARTKGYHPEVTVARMQVVDRKAPVYTYSDGGDVDNWTVAQRYLGKAGARWLPVRKPEAYAGEVLRALLKSDGIAVPKPEIATSEPAGTPLVTCQSAPLREILRDMLKYSTNLTAELVGQMATRARLGEVASLRASAREMSFWARETLGMKGARLVDHSGLGAMSRLTPEAMARALAAVHEAGELKPILKEIALRDASGRKTKKHPIKVVAKTGTLYFVSGLAGYMTSTGGREMAFAIFAADRARRDALPVKLSERPPGAAGWNNRAKLLQDKLIKRWDAAYGTQ